MKFAIMESIITPGGHEVDYDRILVEELTALGHEVEFYVPEGHEFKWNYGAKVHYLPGTGVSYAGSKGIKKICLSAKREINRQRWYKKMHSYAEEGKFDAIIFPSATYRYLRALKLNPLKKTPVPMIFIVHGMTPKEAPLLFSQAEQIKGNPNIKIAVQTFVKSLSEMKSQLKNVSYFYPPNYIPRDVKINQSAKNIEILKLGFFGQYRKEKKLDEFLDVFVTCDFKRSFKLIVQGATTTERDAIDFERIIEKYASYSQTIEFRHRQLIGKEWQEAIAEVDAMVMPYGAERYRYHTSAILSTAIGFYKPVIIADNVNPEVLEQFDIGIKFATGDNQALKTALESFVNTIDDRATVYQEELTRANGEYSPRRLAEQLVSLAK